MLYILKLVLILSSIEGQGSFLMVVSTKVEDQTMLVSMVAKATMVAWTTLTLVSAEPCRYELEIGNGSHFHSVD